MAATSILFQEIQQRVRDKSFKEVVGDPNRGLAYLLYDVTNYGCLVYIEAIEYSDNVCPPYCDALLFSTREDAVNAFNELKERYGNHDTRMQCGPMGNCCFVYTQTAEDYFELCRFKEVKYVSE